MVESKYEFPASSSRRSSTRKSSGTRCMLTFFFLIASAIYVITNYSKLLNESLISKSNNENFEAQKRKDEKIVIHPSENEQKLKIKIEKPLLSSNEEESDEEEKKDDGTQCTKSLVESQIALMKNISLSQE